MKERKYYLYGILLIVGLFSLCIRGAYVNALMHENRYKLVSYNQDSYEYIHLARNIVYEKSYAQSDAYSRYLSVLRTPGYPLFYSVFEYFGKAPEGVLWVQVLIGACISVFTALLSYHIIKNLPLSLIAGLLSSASTPGILLTGEIMVDLLFAFIFLLGFYFLYAGVACSKNKEIFLAGFLFGISALIKPTTIAWPFFSILIFYLLSTSRKMTFKPGIVIVFVSIQIAIIGGWSVRNYCTERIFTLSAIGTQTLRHYLAVKVSEAEKKGNTPSSLVHAIKEEQTRLRREVKNSLDSGISIQELFRTQFKESIDILSANPHLTYLAYIYGIIDNIGAASIRGAYSHRLSEHLFIHKLLVSFISFNIFWILLTYISVIPFFLGMPWFLKQFKDELLRHHFFVSIALILTFLYFALLSGLTFWTGPRIIYPAEFALLIFGMVFGHCIYVICRLTLRKTGITVHG